MNLDLMAFSRNYLPRMKEAYVINLDNKNSKGTHCVSLLFDRSIAVYFDYFGIEYLPLEVLNKIYICKIYLEL